MRIPTRDPRRDRQQFLEYARTNNLFMIQKYLQAGWVSPPYDDALRQAVKSQWLDIITFLINDATPTDIVDYAVQRHAYPSLLTLLQQPHLFDYYVSQNYASTLTPETNALSLINFLLDRQILKPTPRLIAWLFQIGHDRRALELIDTPNLLKASLSAPAPSLSASAPSHH